MPAAPKYDKKEREKIVRKVNEKYATGKYPIVVCCDHFGITYKTFKRWDKEFSKVSRKKAEGTTEGTKAKNDTDDSTTKPKTYADAKAEARNVRRKALRERALTALEYHLEIQEYEEKKQIAEIGKDGKPVTKKIEVTRKRKEPNPMLTRFTLTNVDPENFRESQKIEHSGEIRTLTDLIMQNRERIEREQNEDAGQNSE